MVGERTQRRLAAILAADVVGYSRLMEQDETGTLAALKDRRTGIFDPLVGRHDGRIIKLIGDGVLVEFASAVNAVLCAVDLQHEMVALNRDIPDNRRIEFRIGINIGDVIVEGDDLYGDGINIAARLEALAETGGILVSGPVYDQVSNKVPLRFDDLGPQSVKNISQPVRIYRVADARPDAGRPIDAQGQSPPVFGTKASIAVLPFTNMSSDPEQEYFADGLAEDLITDLSKVAGLVVIARNSTFIYKGRSVDVRSVAKDLNVRYVIEGSVRRASERIRINVQLIDARDSAHVWAERFDRDLTDVFLLQDEVVRNVVGALASVLPSPASLVTRRASNLEAYDLFVRGRALVTQLAEGNRAARPILERSIELDTGFAEAHAWLAMSHHFAWAYWGEDIGRHPALAFESARRAVALDSQNDVAHAILGDILIFAGKAEDGAAELAMALRINPNHADAWTFLGQLKTFEGRPTEGIDDIERALRLNPYPPGWYYWLLGLAQYSARRYAEAVVTLQHEATQRMASQRILAASLARLGRLDEARAEATAFLARNPDFSIRHWADTQPFRHDSDEQRFIDGYLMAGLPA